jgi:hypothetical protein
MLRCNQGKRNFDLLRKEVLAMPDYSDYVFIYDKQGNEYACPMKNIKGQIIKADKLTKEQKKQCLNMAEVIGTERTP